MRRAIYNTLSILPPKLFSGGLGGAGVCATAWPDTFRAWVANMLTADQIEFYGGVAIAVVAIYWILLLALKPNEARDGTPSTAASTSGPNSPLFGTIHGPVTINNGLATEPVKPERSAYKYDIGKLNDSLGRALAALEGNAPRNSMDHIQPGLARRVKGPSKRDVGLSEAIAYAELGEWGRQFIVAAGASGNKLTDHLDRFRQLAHDGELSVWGKRSERGVFERIDQNHWIEYSVEWFDLLRDNPRTENRQGQRDGAFFSLMVNKAEFEREWPHEG